MIGPIIPAMIHIHPRIGMVHARHDGQVVRTIDDFARVVTDHVLKKRRHQIDDVPGWLAINTIARTPGFQGHYIEFGVVDWAALPADAQRFLYCRHAEITVDEYDADPVYLTLAQIAYPLS